MLPLDDEDEDVKDNRTLMDCMNTLEELMDNWMVNCNNNYSSQQLMMEDDNSTMSIDDMLDNTLMNDETIEQENRLECYLSSHVHND